MTRENETYSVTYSYGMEGKYNTSVYVANSLTGNEDWVAHLITVQNNPPIFYISLQPQADEDEIVNISISNLQESEHDKQFGVLTYIFDTADGNQTTTNSSSILYEWTDEGTYPVVVTVIDDQGALSQKSREIDIKNRAPDPDFTIGVEIPATYSFGADLIGAFPLGWNSMNNESRNAFTVIEGTDGHQKILEIKPSHYSVVGIHDTFLPQSKGTIEFWLMSTNISNSASVFSFKDYNKIDQFTVLTKNGEWYYRMGIRDIRIPNLKLLKNIWHHVRIDFLTRGQYLDLYTNTFRIIIDKNESRTINFEGNEIEQFYIIADPDNSGSIAYIDAIGYSWSNGYTVGDNFWDPYHDAVDDQSQVMQYPRKAEIWFSASPTSDSESDLTSLEFYWKFGDGSAPGFGKYVSHEYVNPGTYQVNLTVMDDNGKKASIIRNIMINNTQPNIEFASSQDEIILQEGTTITFNTIVDDDSVDVPRMEYLWHLGDSEFDPLDTELYEQGGWARTYTFSDDLETILHAMAQDPDGALDIDSLDIRVLNVDPSVSICSLDVLANITFEVERSGPLYYDNNFTFILLSTNEFIPNYPHFIKTLKFLESDENRVKFTLENQPLSLLNEWKVLVNTSSPINGSIQYTITLEFLDGKRDILQSNQLSSDHGYWEVNLNSLLYDETNYTFKHPLETGLSIWDPSTDDISLDLYYFVDLALEIECIDPLPIAKSFNINNIYFYDVLLYESGGKKYANISAHTQLINSKEFINLTFPVNINTTFNFNSMIDFTELLVNNVNGPRLSGFSVVDCVSSMNFLDAHVIDDDGGNSSIVVDFDTRDGIEVNHLCPDVNLVMSDGGLMMQNITFYLEYFYRSYSQDGTDVVFEHISILGDTKEQVNSSGYGVQNTFNGTGGDDGNIPTHQSTDAQINLGNTGGINSVGPPINVVGSDGGTSYNLFNQNTENEGPTLYSNNSETLETEDIYNNLVTSHDVSFPSSVSPINHFPGRPYNDDIGNPESWNTIEPGSSYVDVLSSNFAGHEYSARLCLVSGSGEPYMEKSLGSTRSSGILEFWVYTSGADAKIRLLDDGRATMALQFQSTGVYWRDFEGVWKWKLLTSQVTDYQWYRVVMEWYDSGEWDIRIWNSNHILLYSTPNPVDDEYGAPDKISILADDAVGYVYIDGCGNSWETGYQYEQNKFPHQECQTPVISSKVKNLDIDSRNRINSIEMDITYKVDHGIGATVPTVYTYINQAGSGFVLKDIFTPADNSWITRILFLDLSYCMRIGDEYYMNFYLEVYTDVEDKTAPYTVFIDDVETKFSEWQFKGNAYIYKRYGQNIAPTENQWVIKLECNEFQREYSTFEANVEFYLSQSKTYYLQFYKFTGSGTGWQTVQSGTASGNINYDGLFSKDYIANDANPRVEFRIYTSGSNPFYLQMFNPMNAEWSFSYTYWAELEIPLSGMNELRYDNLDSIQLTFEYDESSRMQYWLYNWNLQPKVYQIFDEPEWNGGSGSHDLNFYSTSYIDPDTYVVRTWQDMISHDAPCVLNSLNHWYSWSYSYHDTYSIELSGMNDFRYDHFTSCDFSYGIQTFLGETLNVNMYNHQMSRWDTLDTITTINNMVNSYGSLSFTNNAYIYLEQSTGKYFVNISFTGFSDPYATKLECILLDPKWGYSYTYEDEFEINLTNMDDFRYESFEEAILNYTISTRIGKQVEISLWNYSANDGAGEWVPQYTITAGFENEGSLAFTSNDYIHSSNFTVKIKFTGFTDTEFILNQISLHWGYNFTYYPAYQLHLNDLNSFRYNHFNESTISYQIDLPRPGKSTDVYLFNFSRGGWDYFKTTIGGGYDIQDSITFSSTDYIENNTYVVLINFTGFSETEFIKDYIKIYYNWEYLVQDKYHAILKDMTSHSFNAFECSNITYSIMTTANQSNLQVRLFNFKSSEWVAVGSSFNTTMNTEYHGSVYFTSNDFIDPYQFIVRVHFNGIEDSFLTLNWMKNEYSWSHYNVYCDFGHDNLGMTALPYLNMTSFYLNVYNASHVFDNAGNYLITWTVSDGIMEVTQGRLIEILYPTPSISIGDIPTYITEDQLVYLESSIEFAEDLAQEAEYSFFWEFGDNLYSISRNPSHSWGDSGNFTIVLHVRDLYGNYFNDSITIEVHEKYPGLMGSRAFYGVEGQAIVLDVDVSDSLFDRRDLSFTWYDDNFQEITEFSNNPKPVVFLQDGEYMYTLDITDINGYKITSIISIFVDDVPPSVFMSNYMYYGNSNAGVLTLTAYGYDYYEDRSDLEITWRISHGNITDLRGPYPNYIRNSIQFHAMETAIYQGQVEIRDLTTNRSNIAIFYINSMIDSNGNGFSDEFERCLAESGETIYSFFDTDKDGISDLYEITCGETHYLYPDSDGDGLYDGIDRETGIGEYTAGTDPTNPDSDGDSLYDGTEILGWSINTEREGAIQVASNPNSNDTDDDGLSDAEEFQLATHPNNPDTDFDGLRDDLDPFPLKADGDGDGLLDSEELAIGTSCNNSDTDGDTIKDGEETKGWFFQTDPLSADTDHDFVSDSAEMIKKDASIRSRMSLDQPITIKFNHYFTRATSAQISFVVAFGEVNDAIDYGIQEVPDLSIIILKSDSNLMLYEGKTEGSRYFSQVIDIRELIETNSLNYFGEYTIRINASGTGCLLEQFDLNVLGYLNPTIEDFDADGLMDGVEMNLLTRGTGIINFTSDYADNNISINRLNPMYEDYLYEEEEPEINVETYSLTIPDIGRVYDATIMLEIASNIPPIGYGTTNITLTKEDISNSIKDVVLLDHYSAFYKADFKFNTFIDLTEFLDNGIINQFYGKYRLDITILAENHTHNVFNLTKFFIETDTFIQVTNENIDAWITDASNPDSDGDSISDFDEIYGWNRGSDIYYTNPVDADTDGDNANDNVDRHPNQNIMLKISPQSATHCSQAYWENSPTLEIVTQFNLDDGDYYIPSQMVKATEDLWSKVIMFIRYQHYRRTNFATANGGEGIHYYIDISDDLNVQSENIQFDFSLWQMGPEDLWGNPLWDIWLAGGSDTYTIGNIGHSEVLSAYTTGIWDQPNELHVKIETIAVEKANTIAIHENSTVFNGHYQEKEKMNIIVLNVIGNAQGTPFKTGPNAIVIPTRLFTQTKLNGFIEREELDQTPLYSDVEGEFEFISVGRNGTTDEGCDEVDFVIIRFNMDIADAMEVLSMLITIIVNDTTVEEAELYEFQSTKESGASAELMNLHKEVLGYIPWYCNFKDSDQGRKPQDFFEWNGQRFTGSLMALAYVFYMIGVVIAQLFVSIARFIAGIFMEVLSFLGPLLWLIVRAVLLIFLYILISFHLLVQISTFIALGTSMLLIAPLTGGYCKFNAKFLELLIYNKLIRLESKVNWIYWEFFDMSFPWAEDRVLMNGTLYMKSNKGLLNGETNVEFNELEMTINQTEAPPTLHCSYDQINETIFNFWTYYDDSRGGCGEPDPTYGVRLHLIAPNGTALDYYVLSVNPDFLPSPDYTAPVMYNCTIDLSTIYPEQGLWHYYFSSKDNSSEHEPVIMPVEGYLLGPELTLDKSLYLFAHAVSSNFDDYYLPSGFKNDTFIFRTWWGCSVAPASVSVGIIPANKTDGVGISNTFGIKKFLMSTTQQNPNYSQEVEYNYTINFRDLGYADDELGWFHHYYEAIFPDGNKTYLYEVGGIDEEDIDMSDLYYKDFRQPFVTNYGAQLLDYAVQHNSISLIGGLIGKNRVITSESKLEFEVVCMDPYGGYPQDFYPKLIFENVITGQNITFQTYDYWETSFSEKFGENTFSCIFHLNGEDLPSGMWSFRFEAKDCRGNEVPTIYGMERFQMIGSLLSMWYAFNDNIITGGISPLAAFTFAIPFMPFRPSISVVLSLAGTLGGLVYSSSRQREYCKNGDMGSLLGQSIALMFTSLTMAFTSTKGFLSKLNSKIFKLVDKFSIWYKYYAYITLAQFFLAQLPFRVGDFDFTVLYDIISLPLEVVQLFTMGTLGKISFAIASSDVSNIGTIAVSACEILYSFGAMVLSIIGFLIFSIKTQGYGVFNN